MTDDILAKYPQTAGNPLAMAMLCHVLKDRGLIDDAYAMGLAALAAAPGDTEVRDIARGALSAGIPKWHAPMLRDEARNRCYATAIERAVEPGMRVLEIGTGAGLLALIAARAGAHVVTCEADPTVAAAAREIVSRNGFADRISVVGKHSTALVIGEDLDTPADLIVSEIFGKSLFDEGVVAALGDARARLLAPGARSIPPRAELRCALLSLDGPHDPPLGSVEGFDLSPFAALVPPPRPGLRPSANPTLRSDPISALPLDFTAAPFGPTRQRIELVSYGGRVDGVVQWLRIDFGDGLAYENIPMTDKAAHWAATVHPLAAPIDTQPGEAITFDVRTVINQLLMTQIPA